MGTMDLFAIYAGTFAAFHRDEFFHGFSQTFHRCVVEGFESISFNYCNQFVWKTVSVHCRSLSLVNLRHYDAFMNTTDREAMKAGVVFLEAGYFKGKGPLAGITLDELRAVFAENLSPCTTEDVLGKNDLRRLAYRVERWQL